MARISIASPQTAVPIDRDLIRRVAKTVLEGEEVENYEISIAFVDNVTIHRLNKRYLNHDEPTDVLSFPLSGPGAKKLTGEIVIGAEVAQAEAETRGHSVEAELALYVIHGLLHLCGEDDRDDEARSRMRAKERQYLAACGLPDIVETDTN